MHVKKFVQIGSNKVSNVPYLRDMQHELHSLMDERNLVGHLNDGLSFHVLQLTVDAGIQRRVAHGTNNLQFLPGLLRYVYQSPASSFKFLRETYPPFLGQAQGVTS